MIWIWVRILGAGTPLDPWRPDVPAGFHGWHYDDSIILDRAAPPPHPLASAYARIGVEPADAARLKNTIAEGAIPRRDVLLHEMVRAHRRNWAASEAWLLTQSALAREAPQDAAALIMQARARGLAADRAVAVAKQLGLADLEVADAQAR